MAYIPGKCLLRVHLKKAGMSQTELANRIEVSPQIISDYVNGRRKMNLAVARTISSILDCSIEDLYEWKVVPPSAIRSRQR